MGYSSKTYCTTFLAEMQGGKRGIRNKIREERRSTMTANVKLRLGPLAHPDNKDVLQALVEKRWTDVPVKTLLLDPTHACCFKCPSCIEQETMAASGRASLPLPYILDTLDQFATQGGTTLGLYGGEPTMSPGFPRILRHACGLGLHVRVVTNGYFLRGEVAKAIIEKRDLVQCRVSWNAATETTHTRLHRPPEPCFDRIVSQTQELARAGVQAGVSFLVLEENHAEVWEAATLAREIGIDFFQVRPATGCHGEGVIELPPATRANVLEQILRARSLRGPNFEFKYTRWYRDYLETGVLPAAAKSYSFCGMALLRGIVSPPKPGSYSVCPYRRGDPRFAFEAPKPFGQESHEERVARFQAIDPRIYCANVLCSWSEVNEGIYELIRRAESGADPFVDLGLERPKSPLVW